LLFTKIATEERRKEVRTVGDKLKKVECDPKCGFAVQSHDEKEVIDIAMKHAKKAHNMDVTEKDARGMMKDA
jgi:predicted small metal-binding protein